MVKITVEYPINESSWFDITYYAKKHLPLSKSIFGSVLKGVTIEQRVDEHDYGICKMVIGCLFFNTADDFYNHYLPAAELLSKDAENYTNVTPRIHLSIMNVMEDFSID